MIVAAAVARLTTDNGFGGSAVFDRVNIVERYGTATSSGLLETGTDSSVITTDVRAAIEAALAPIVVTWVASLGDVIGTGQDLPSYEDVGAVLTLGRPTIDGEQATMTTGLWCGGTCGVGGAHTLEKLDAGAWVVTGSTGPQWMS